MKNICSFIKDALIAKAGQLIVVVLLFFSSTVLLPYLEKDNIGPFYRWALFDKKNTNTMFDIYMKKGEKDFFLTSGPEPYLPNSLGIMLWNIAYVSNSSEVNEDQKKSMVILLKKELEHHEVAPLGFCEIQIDLPRYVLMTHEEKKKICEKNLRKI